MLCMPRADADEESASNIYELSGSSRVDLKRILARINLFFARAQVHPTCVIYNIQHHHVPDHATDTVGLDWTKEKEQKNEIKQNCGERWEHCGKTAASTNFLLHYENIKDCAV